jgi:hypothetical protein
LNTPGEKVKQIENQTQKDAIEGGFSVKRGVGRGIHRRGRGRARGRRTRAQLFDSALHGTAVVDSLYEWKDESDENDTGRGIYGECGRWSTCQASKCRRKTPAARANHGAKAAMRGFQMVSSSASSESKDGGGFLCPQHNRIETKHTNNKQYSSIRGFKQFKRTTRRAICNSPQMLAQSRTPRHNLQPRSGTMSKLEN